MTENKLRETAGILIIALHFGMLSALSLLWAKGGFSFKEFTTTFAILTPLLAAYVATIIAYFSKKRFQNTDRSKKVTAIFVFISLGFPTLFSLVMCLIMLLFAKGVLFADFEQFKATFAITEAIFAGYVATTTNTLFRPSSPP